MQERFYRKWVQENNLIGFEVKVKETDLFIRADKNLANEARVLVVKYRNILKEYLRDNPVFLKSLVPVEIKSTAPIFVQEMVNASCKAGVGPMASVAGVIAEFVGKELLTFSKEILVENGGDIFLKTLQKRTVAIYAGKSPLSGKIGIEITPEMGVVGVCTSSGKVGHSLSFGCADSVTVISKSAILADAWATSLANRVKSSSEIEEVLKYASEIKGIRGVVIIVDEKIGFTGKIRILKV
ncbi:MAG: UPF0280 family protein [Candidatus Saelkia tenebricola]|nr:UPF0280 family protein [Candidatus Saelkia tenebricola]